MLWVSPVPLTLSIKTIPQRMTVDRKQFHWHTVMVKLVSPPALCATRSPFWYSHSTFTPPCTERKDDAIKLCWYSSFAMLCCIKSYMASLSFFRLCNNRTGKSFIPYQHFDLADPSAWAHTLKNRQSRLDSSLATTEFIISTHSIPFPTLN